MTTLGARVRRVGTGCVVAAVAAVSVCAYAEQRPMAGRKVSGVVIDAATGRGVPAAHVQYEENGGQAQTTTTDARGRFEFPAGVRGLVTVTAAGFGTARRAWPPRYWQTLEIVLEPPASLQGTVRDAATGRGLAGLVTFIVRHPHNVVSSTARAERGSFVVEDLPPGPVVLVARAEGFAPYVGATRVEAGLVRDVRIGMVLEQVVAGRVVRQSGGPLAGAMVNVRYAHAADRLLRGFVGGSPITDSDGAFFLRGVVQNTPLSLRAETADGRVSNVVTVVVGSGGAPDVTLVVRD